ncbi:MAG: penicillin-binding transpeptidase domain-containing protein [Patescibacteria group bacterium]
MKKPLLELDPDEVFIDSSNLPDFNTAKLEGQIERPLNKRMLYVVIFCLMVVTLIYLGRTFYLQINRGPAFALRSESNTLRELTIFAERGVIYDRQGKQLAWNDPDRVYRSGEALAHVLGYVSYPKAEELNGDRDPKDLIGRAGSEKLFDHWLAGTHGHKIEEVDVRGKIHSDYLYQEPKNGNDLTLSIDTEVQEKLFELIKVTAEERGFRGGSGVILDLQTGELLALTSYPSYDPEVMSSGKEAEKIKEFLTNPRTPFLNRATAGLYPPGSTIKPMMAIAALNEKIIVPETQILSTGSLVIPNPYNPDQPSVFRDWKAHGLVNMWRALAISSDVYFYEIGGGFKDQLGLGIKKIDEYAKLFGLAQTTGFPLEGEDLGTIPTPEWKEKVFGEPWRLGNTYHTAIGQYGFQVTPLQITRAIGAIARGALITPTIVAANQATEAEVTPIDIPEAYFKIVREGMRLAVTEGTASGLSVPYVKIAAKTGTAEIGSEKKETHSWITGFFPYETPRYAFTITMERGPSTNLIGGVFIMRQLFDWLKTHKPEYLGLPPIDPEEEIE